MVRLGRRGMSPLIATVLLMAFAVALGGMIMNWGDRMVNDPTQMCANVDLTISALCARDDGIQLQVLNDGEVPLAALTVSIVRDNGEFNTDVANSQLGSGQRMQSTVPILVKPTDTVRLLAKVGTDRDTQLCPEPIQSISPIPSC